MYRNEVIVVFRILIGGYQSEVVAVSRIVKLGSALTIIGVRVYRNEVAAVSRILIGECGDDEGGDVYRSAGYCCRMFIMVW